MSKDKDGDTGIPKALQAAPEDAAERKRANEQYAKDHPPVVNALPPEPREPVMLAYDPTDPAICVRPGAEQSDIKFKVSGHERTYPNEVLEKKSSIGPLRYARIMRELPTERHRQIFRELFGEGKKKGPGRGASRGDDVAVDATEKDSAAAAAPSKKRSRAEAGGTGSSPVRSTTDKPRPRGKPEQVAAVREMLTRPEGATLAEIGKLYGWKEPSASAFISVNFRNHGEPTSKKVVDGRGTVYNLTLPSKEKK